MLNPESARLRSGELAVLDAVIAVAQQIGIRLDDLDDDDCDEHATEGAADTIEARHDGLFRVIEEQILPHIESLSKQIDTAPTLRRLIELRAAATRYR